MLAQEMNVLFYYYYGAGGGLSNIEMLLRTLAREFPGDEYVVMCAPSSRLSALHGVDGIRVTPVASAAGKELSRLAAGLWGLRARVRQLGPDVLWCINSGSYVAAGVPQVLSLHNAHQVYPLAQACFGASARVKLPLLRWFFRRTLAQSEGVIVQTELMKRYVAAIAQAPSRIAVIPKSVETADDVVLEPLPERILHALDERAYRFSFTFLYAADVKPAKNHRTLLHAMALLRATGVPARLVLTASEPELLALGASAESLIADGYVVPVAHTSRPHVRALYEACDACVMPSLLESLSSAHLEAMQWGKPQISADLPYARELCGEASLYASPRDGQDWAAQMRDLMADPVTQSRLAQAGRRRMSAFPQSWADAARRVRAFLAETVAQARDSGASNSQLILKGKEP